MSMRIGPWLFAAAGLFFAVSSTPQEGADIQGAWHTETYYLKDGARHGVEGLIFFTERDWTVLFFVMGEDGIPRRGSGEGGTYIVTADQLVLTHLYHVSAGKAMEGLPDSPLRMEVNAAADAPTEPCRVKIESDRMSIHFPSGNYMTFRRSSN